MDMLRVLGLDKPIEDPAQERERLHLYINLKFASSGQPYFSDTDKEGLLNIAGDLLQAYREKNRLLSNYLCPPDARIQQFIDRYLGDLNLPSIPRLPVQTFILDRHGLARELSLPMDSDSFKSDIVESYRIKQGVLHNPASDRRTTEGSFHIAEGGLPIPGDKKAVPKKTFALMLEQALQPPEHLLELPFSANRLGKVKMFVSLLLRPVVCPEVPGAEAEKSMEIRFFAPGNLVSNLDFVESIFGNGGNPHLASFDAALDTEHWTGHSGCVILAPHLVRLTKKELGLPHWDMANDRQRREGMCWKDPAELYNNGQAFKLTARDESGTIVTILADNYYGYCKKEVKTQISFSANLYGLAEEEHAGGALAFRRRNHGEEYGVDSRTRTPGYSFDQVVKTYGDILQLMPEGYAIDRRFPDLIYVHQDLRMDLNSQKITWNWQGRSQSIRLQPGKIYMQPNGYKIEMVKHPGAPSWRLIGTDPEGTFCHKPCTVSGGGKSEISKSLDDAIIYGPLFVDNLDVDLERVQEVFDRDYRNRFKPGLEQEDRNPSRQPLSAERSLGSVIKLLTPSSSHTDEYNAWLDSIPPRILALVFLIKRFYRPDWGSAWRQHLSVDEVDGSHGHELKMFDRKIIASYLRLGFDPRGKWRTFKLRQDFIAAEKVQMEDDISASVVTPSSRLADCMGDKTLNPSLKLVKNCEYRLFQRPDDAVIPGYDKQTEWDMAQPGNFIANFEPLDQQKLTAATEDVLNFCSMTQPMQALLTSAQADKSSYVVSSAMPRMVNGKPSKNPRYLQIRPDIANPLRTYTAEMGVRLHRKLPLSKAVCHPVDAVLTGRRNNPAEPGIRALAVYNPIHYQELPELFMDFICSLTGKSPSTTGAGSEGALTKGPFNALRPTADLNNALVSYILTQYAGFSSSAGYIGSNLRVDHDISLLVPEIWCRLTPAERNPSHFIAQGYLEKLSDFEHKGRKVLASRLGYRITERFVHGYMGKIFDNPSAAMTEAILKPETQDLESFVDGVHNIVETQQRVARTYLEDGSFADACPPLQALLHIMAHGHHEGRDIQHPAIRAMFTRDYLLASDWYRERLEVKQERDIRLWKCHLHSLQTFAGLSSHSDVAAKLDIAGRIAKAQAQLDLVQSPAYLEQLVGTIGADPLRPYRETQAVGQQAA